MIDHKTEKGQYKDTKQRAVIVFTMKSDGSSSALHEFMHPRDELVNVMARMYLRVSRSDVLVINFHSLR
jgi:hypothetical protein